MFSALISSQRTSNASSSVGLSLTRNIYNINVNRTRCCKGKGNLCIALIMSYSSLGAQVWHVLTRDHTVLPLTHTFIHKWDEACLPSIPSHTASPHFWTEVISRPAEGRRLNWTGRLVERRGFACPKTVTHPTCRGGRELNPVVLDKLAFPQTVQKFASPKSILLATKIATNLESIQSTTITAVTHTANCFLAYSP